MKKRKFKKRKRNGLKLIAVMVMIICGVVLYKTRDLNASVAKKNEMITKLNAGVEEQNSRTQELEEKRLYQSTNRYIEELARTKLGLCYPDEYIVKEAP